LANLGDGNNVLTAGNGIDEVHAGGGDNNIVTVSGEDVVTAGNGNNVIAVGDNSADLIQAGDGDNSIDFPTAAHVTLGEGNNFVRQDGPGVGRGTFYFSVLFRFVARSGHVYQTRFGAAR
jgi:Ca2+-binding RTX toxin-like protein